ncbi:hypothetical protein C0991_006861 [Blastosporella zonata]|nr:hypothetical protein C0991_006861 [Blastosporella zonata]
MARGGGRKKRLTSTRKSAFDPSDTKNVKQSHVGVWDLYEEIQPELAHIPGSSRLEPYLEIKQNLPFVWRMLKDISSIRALWAATTKDAEYIRMEGLKRTVNDVAHRKEIVAGGLQEYLFNQFQRTSQALGDRAGNFMELMRLHHTATLSPFSFLQDPLKELPQIVFTLRAVQYPASIPLSLASLNLITQTAAGFTNTLVSLYDDTGSLAQKIADVRRLYEVANIPNRVEDGTQPYPEDEKSLEMGISVEFRLDRLLKSLNVYFRYPSSKAYALEDVSFKIEKGQLCIIVGANGSGKSTVLKLISRLYEPESGEILIDGRDIKLLKLDDLRRAISVLFQDYTHFPLSIKENIGLGDPQNATDEDKIRQAAHLGGAEEFIERLPEGFETYLDRPVRDYYSALPEGTTTLFGRAVDYGRIRSVGKMEATSSKSLSGGQMQRIALSRTFMRSLVSQPRVGLLLFDEPSASLDPKAEHDLFERLRNLRGNKTMIFSSHRFGNLTRHADLILYMNDSVVVEEGTHKELLKKDGEYAHIWNLQAQAFLA